MSREIVDSLGAAERLVDAAWIERELTQQLALGRGHAHVQTTRRAIRFWTG